MHVIIILHVWNVTGLCELIGNLDQDSSV
jgi:hypothetical protein